LPQNSPVFKKRIVVPCNICHPSATRKAMNYDRAR
jgi:hypothetical protein